MKKTVAVLSVSMLLVTVFVFNAFAEPLVKKFARPGPRPELYYSGVMVDKTYYVAGSGDGRPENLDESYKVKTQRCFASIQRSLKMADLDLENVVQAWVMLEDPNGVKDMTAAWKETFPTNSPARTTFSVANIQTAHITIVSLCKIYTSTTSIKFEYLLTRIFLAPESVRFRAGRPVWHAVYVHRHTGAPFRLDPVDVFVTAQAAAQLGPRRYRVG